MALAAIVLLTGLPGFPRSDRVGTVPALASVISNSEVAITEAALLADGKIRLVVRNGFSTAVSDVRILLRYRPDAASRERQRPGGIERSVYATTEQPFPAGARVTLVLNPGITPFASPAVPGFDALVVGYTLLPM